MKAISIIFAAFAVLALVGVIMGARHQLVMVALCTFLALMAWPEKNNKAEPVS